MDHRSKFLQCFETLTGSFLQEKKSLSNFVRMAAFSYQSVHGKEVSAAPFYAIPSPSSINEVETLVVSTEKGKKREESGFLGLQSPVFEEDLLIQQEFSAGVSREVLISERFVSERVVKGGKKERSKGICECDVMLKALQTTGLVKDQKTIVDMPLKYSLNYVEAAFAALPREANGTLLLDVVVHFLSEHFDQPGSDLLPYIPKDYDPEPKDFLPSISDPEIKSFALKIHETWLLLSRLMSPSVSEFPEKHSLIDLPHAVAIPGSRFREVYYWDSYWIIRGLLISKMPLTAMGIVYNLLSLGKRYGFVPNGARSYYINRSQPPLLSEMVKLMYETTKDFSLLQEALPILVEEHKYWTSHPHQVLIRDSNGKVHKLSRYYAKWSSPRPESYCQDTEAAQLLDPVAASRLYTEIASVAESGWDFSSRWMSDERTWQSFRTTSMIPVDLNAFLYQMEENISYFAELLGDKLISKKFSKIASERKEAMDSLLWNENSGQWFDFVIPTENNFESLQKTKTNLKNSEPKVVKIFEGGNQNKSSYSSNFVPLWCGLLEPGDKRGKSVVNALKSSGLIQPFGVAVSIYLTGEQWDFPNSWAPLEHMIIEGLEKTKMEEAQILAQELASSWLFGVFVAFQKTGTMHEKYDVRKAGGIGGGGEYAPQVGFGWTNAVTLCLLDKYGWSGEHVIEDVEYI